MHLQDMVADSAGLQQTTPGAGEALPPYAHRTVLSDAADACGVEPVLRLQQNFGAAYLGELLQAYISASNVSAQTVQSVHIRVRYLLFAKDVKLVNPGTDARSCGR